MIVTFIVLLAVLYGGPVWEAPAGSTSLGSASEAASTAGLAATGYTLDSGSPSMAATPEPPHHVYLPFVTSNPSTCQPIPGAQYASLDVEGPPTDRPAEAHADLNLSLRGYETTSAYLGLVEYGGGGDPRAPQLNTIFTDRRLPAFTAAYQVHEWDWSCNCRAGLATNYPVTLLGMGVSPGEVLTLPDSGYNIGSGYQALVLYASEERITLKYTREDNVVRGYTLHLDNICVEPSLLALYRTWDDAGRRDLPAIRSGQPVGRAMGSEIRVAIRDSGTFMDPRSRRDWWRSK